MLVNHIVDNHGYMSMCCHPNNDPYNLINFFLDSLMTKIVFSHNSTGKRFNSTFFWERPLDFPIRSLYHTTYFIFHLFDISLTFIYQFFASNILNNFSDFSSLQRRIFSKNLSKLCEIMEAKKVHSKILKYSVDFLFIKALFGNRTLCTSIVSCAIFSDLPRSFKKNLVKQWSLGRRKL